ncbi:MAG: molybdopterin-guanine dinucleotide biosynthesis protein B [Conexivisphaera sp.]
MDRGHRVPVVAVVGGRKSGKTTVVEAITRELTESGYRVAVLKHIHHDEFDFDVPGKDTWRAFRAGSVAVVGASSSRAFLGIRGSPRLPVLLRLVEELSEPDIVLLEGFSSELSQVPGVRVISMGGRDPVPQGELLCECRGPEDAGRAVGAVRGILERAGSRPRGGRRSG